MTMSDWRIAEKEALAKLYGTAKNGRQVPRMIAVKDPQRARTRVSWLIKRLNGDLELCDEDRREIAAGLERCMAGASFEQAFGIARQRHRPASERSYYQAVEFRLRRLLGESAQNARQSVARRWGSERRPLSDSTVRKAASKHGREAKAWIARFEIEHRLTYEKLAPELVDEDTARRAMLLMIDHEIEGHGEEHVEVHYLAPVVTGRNSRE